MSSAESPHEEPPRSKVFRISKKVREDAFARVKIGVAGNGGSFSQKAALTFATEKYQKEGEDSIYAVIEIVYLITTRAVLEALQKKEVDIGIYAKMNNHGGPVRENMKAEAEIAHSLVEDEDGLPTVVKLPVKHVLMTRPGAQRKIRTIVTQLQAYEQCKATIDFWWPGAEIVYYDDTATAANDLADGSLAQKKGIDLATAAVVGPEECAEENGLAVNRKLLRFLRKHVQDHKNNETTFVVAKHLSPEAVEKATLDGDEAAALV
jgi:prephenate dehydratase